MAEIVKLGQPKPAPDTKPPAAPEEERSRLPLIIAGVVALLVVCGGIFFAIRGSAPVEADSASASTRSTVRPAAAPGAGGAAAAPSPSVAPAVSSIQPGMPATSSGSTTAPSMPPSPMMAPPMTLNGTVTSTGVAPRTAAPSTFRRPTDDDPYAGGPHDR